MLATMTDYRVEPSCQSEILSHIAANNLDTEIV